MRRSSLGGMQICYHGYLFEGQQDFIFSFSAFALLLDLSKSQLCVNLEATNQINTRSS